jgi:predicted RNA binding protein YcfA (HicA-like mRNA interferase family)
MSEKLPRITAAEAIRVLEKSGFFLSRQSGSHKIFKNETGQRITIPFHAGEILHPKIVKSMLRDADISLERLKELLK